MGNGFAILGGAAAILIAVVMARSFRRVGPDERLIVERLGMHARTVGPGWIFVMPVIERGIRLPLAQYLPGWQAYPEDQLRKKVVAEYYREANRPS